MKEKNDLFQLNEVDILLKELPAIANNSMKDLNADFSLKNRIENSAYNNAKPIWFKHKKFNLYAISSACLMFAFAFLIFINPFKKADIDSITAKNSVASVKFFNSNPSSAISDDKGESLIGTRASNDALISAISIFEDDSLPTFQSAWAEGNDIFPFVTINNKVFRLLNSNNIIVNSPQNIGSIVEHSDYPEESIDKISSNILNIGTQIYTLPGLENTLIYSVQSNNEYRVFQRVSYGNLSLVNNENFKDTFNVLNKTKSISLNSAGIITSPLNIDLFIQAMMEKCVYINSNSGNDFSDTLQFQLDNGALLQLMVDNDRISACGEYSFVKLQELFLELKDK